MPDFKPFYQKLCGSESVYGFIKIKFLILILLSNFDFYQI